MDDATFISQATIEICDSLDPDTVLRRCADFLINFMPIGSISMTVYDVKTHSLRNIAYYIRPNIISHATPGYWQKSIKIPDRDWLKIMSTKSDTCIIVNDASKSPAGQLICKEIGISDLSYIVLRLDVGDELLGHIVIGNEGINLYTQEHARLLKLIRGPFSIAMNNAIQHQEVVRLKDLLSEDNRYLFSKLNQAVENAIVGKDRGLRHVMKTVKEVAKLNTQVILLGETGVGKELVANAIHYNSAQANGPFVKINCGAIPDNLIDSELFGHEKGAFTGAVASKRGHFERAHNGTLFLDEIGDLPPSAQVRLLRVLQQKELIRVGGTQPIKVNVRIITATHHDLEEMVKRGEFRADLWFRINVFPIRIPPLRQRKEDIPELVEYFISRKSQEMNLRHRPGVSPQTMKQLQTYNWPGNVRELENTIERALIQNVIGNQDAFLEFNEIGESVQQSRLKLNNSKAPGSLSHNEITKQHFEEVLNMTKGKIQGEDGAAALLQMHPSTLRHQLRKLGISFGRQQVFNPVDTHPRKLKASKS